MDNPWLPGQFDDYLNGVLDTILKVGWVIQGVFPTTEDEIGFAYTVGLTVHRRTELVISGMWNEQAQHLLNTAAQLHLDKQFEPGDTNTEITANELPLRIIRAPLAELGTATRLYGRKARALQLVWPDDNGNWPGDTEWNPTFKQELLGPAWWSTSGPEFEYPCPTCPLCGKPPIMAISPQQTICSEKDCPAITWDMTRSKEENLADTNFIEMKTPGN